MMTKRNTMSGGYLLAWDHQTSEVFTKKNLQNHLPTKLPGSLKNYVFFRQKYTSPSRIEFISNDFLKKETIIHIEYHKDGFLVRCNCCKTTPGLCGHSVHLLIKILSHQNASLQSLFILDVVSLPEEEQRFFAIREKYKGVEMIPHKDFGKVFPYHPVFFSQVSTAVLSASNPVNTLAKPFKKICFAIVKDIGSTKVPLLLPFLSKNVSGTSFGFSYLLNQEQESSPSLYTPAERALENISIKMLDLIHNLNESEDIKTEQAAELEDNLIILWGEAIKIAESENVLFYPIYHNNNKIKYISMGRFDKNRMKPLVSHVDRINFLLILESNSDHSKLSLSISNQNKELGPRNIHHDSNGYIMELESSYVLIQSPPHAEIVHNLYECDLKLTVLPKHYQSFYDGVLRPIVETIPLEIKYGDDDHKKCCLIKSSTPNIRKVIKIQKTDELLILQPVVYYGRSEIALYAPGTYVFWDLNTFFDRDQNEEQSFTCFLSKHISLENKSYKSFIILPLDLVKKDFWLSEFIKKCTLENINTEFYHLDLGDEDCPVPLKLMIDTVENENLLDQNQPVSLRISLSSDNESYDSLDLLKVWSLQKSSQTIISSEQKHMYIGEKDKHILRVLLHHGRIDNNRLVLHPSHWLSLNAARSCIQSPKLIQLVQEKQNKLNNMEHIPLVPIPNGIQATLRPYQHFGFSWMVFLREFGWGGILSDDMGLGKTLQTITLLEYHHQQCRDAAPSLIVLPNSLISNWAAEIKRFAPGRPLYIYHGPQRQKPVPLPMDTWIITSYGTLIRDFDWFKSLSFSYVILDESQHVKNAKTKRFSTVKSLKKDHILALSGTPIENSLNELFAQVSLINPSVLGDFSSINQVYPGIIDGHASPETLEQVKALIQPFILRRTKKQVAPELPDKTETICYLNLPEEVRKIYDAVRQFYKGEIQNQLETEPVYKVTKLALSGLQKLRQICNAPSLLNTNGLPEKLVKSFGEFQKLPSIKLETLNEQMISITPSNKVLIFSFFTSMLQKISENLMDLNIIHSYLDGKMSIQKRDKNIYKFKNEDDCRAFLISLRAGGMGLNLTEADYVYILDPWWNPAVEAQAIDRTHRIGQKNHIMAYKMICRNTVEEGIQALQLKKQQLSSDWIKSDEDPEKSIDKGNLFRLFD